jgi:transposase
MCLQPRDFSVVPEETARVAHAAFPKGNPYLTLRDELGVIYEDSTFAPFFGSLRGRPAESPGCLALVTVLQFAENLSDRQAADAVRGRIDWKYLLGLELTDPGFDHTLLYEFRNRVLENEAEEQLLDIVLEMFRDRKLLKARGRQRTDSTNVLAAIRDLNYLELIGETMRRLLNSLAVLLPDWVREQTPQDWFERYSQPFSQWQLPKSKSEREELAHLIGYDGFKLWQMMEQSPEWMWLREVPAVETLRQVWLQQFYVEDEVVRWRKKADRPPAGQRIASPYDTEARWATRRSTHWCGYKVHLTETCEEDLPLLITNVETTPSTTEDFDVTETIHQHLDERDLLPAEHLLDAGYINAQILTESQSDHGVDVVGPVRRDPSWQAKAGEGFDLACFAIDWEQQIATCPRGKTSVVWSPHIDTQGNDRIAIGFATSDCRVCPSRSQCVHSQTRPRRICVRPKEQHVALQKARQRMTTDEFKQAYAPRAGVEGTISQGTRRFDLRRCRYIGLAKTHLQHVLTAVAIDLMRVADWLDKTPRAQTRCSRFATLAPAVSVGC